MWTRRPTPGLDVACRIAAVFSLGIATVNASPPQQGQVPSGPPPSSSISVKDEMRNMQTREAQLRDDGRTGREATDRRYVKAAIEEVRRDFTRIQVLRNDIARRLVARERLDYGVVASKTGEINKRASRLKAYMLPDGPDRAGTGGAAPEVDADRLEGALVALCHSIDAFSENPVFDAPELIDARQTARAKGDLERIIDLSARIKREAQRLRKSAGR
jgi:hypothetical protein